MCFCSLAPKGKTPSGGDVWVLLITDTKPTDSDLYVCELNSDPPIKSFHSLRGKHKTKSIDPLNKFVQNRTQNKKLNKTNKTGLTVPLILQ